MRRKLFAATVPLVVLLLANCADAPTSPQRSLAPSTPRLQASVFSQNFVFPVTEFVYVPCAADGAGEIVQLSGELHDTYHVTISSAGQLSLKFHDNTQGLSGVGQTTGAAYNASNVLQGMLHESVVTGFPVNDTFVNNLHVIGNGQGRNFNLHETRHLTVNADGTLTSSRDKFTVDCE